MKRFKNILLLADNETGMKQLIKRASDLAQANNAELTIMDVQNDYYKGKNDVVSDKYLAEIQTASTKSVLDRLTKIWESYRSNNTKTKVKVKVLTGTPFLETIKEILREKNDLLIKVAEEKKGLKPMLFGTTDMHLMRKCPCALWIIKPTRKRKYHRVMAAVDPESTGKDDLNIKILDLATSLSNEDHSELHIVHAWNFYGEAALKGSRIKMQEDKLDTILKKIKLKATRDVQELLNRYDLSDIKHKIHILKGKPSDLIPETAEKYKIDLIVMGTLARSSVAGLFIGNTAEQVLNRVNCSVLTVKPEGFKTPVTID